MKTLELKMSGVRISAEFGGIPSGLPNQAIKYDTAVLDLFVECCWAHNHVKHVVIWLAGAGGAMAAACAIWFTLEEGVRDAEVVDKINSEEAFNLWVALWEAVGSKGGTESVDCRLPSFPMLAFVSAPMMISFFAGIWLSSFSSTSRKHR